MGGWRILATFATLAGVSSHSQQLIVLGAVESKTRPTCGHGAYGSILGWMNVHLPPILIFTRGTGC